MNIDNHKEIITKPPSQDAQLTSQQEPTTTTTTATARRARKSRTTYNSIKY
jgi:hypothetical protein